VNYRLSLTQSRSLEVMQRTKSDQDDNSGQRDRQTDGRADAAIHAEMDGAKRAANLLTYLPYHPRAVHAVSK